jgi:hypothetical protein
MLLAGIWISPGTAQEESPSTPPPAAQTTMNGQPEPSSTGGAQPSSLDPTGLTSGLEQVVGPVTNLNCAVSAPGGVMAVLQCTESEDR